MESGRGLNLGPELIKQGGVALDRTTINARLPH